MSNEIPQENIQEMINKIIVRLDALESGKNDYSDRLTLRKHFQLLDGRNIQTGKTTGTKIGTETSQKIGFYNTTPVVQAAAIGKPSGGVTVDSQARTAINSIIDALGTALGIGITA